MARMPCLKLFINTFHVVSTLCPENTCTVYTGVKVSVFDRRVNLIFFDIRKVMLVNANLFTKSLFIFIDFYAPFDIKRILYSM